MTKLGKIAVAVVLATFASTAAAVEGGWNTKYGMLFDLQNIFGNNNASSLAGYQGATTGAGVGVQMNLAPTRALRMVASISRASNPVYEETTLAGTAKIVPSVTSAYALDVGAAYMVRLTTGTISPYLGMGASLNFSQSGRSGDARAAGSTTTTTYDNTDRSYGLGVDGTLGVEWRVHNAVAVFAEYALGVGLIQRDTVDHNTKTSTGTVLVDTSSTQTRLVNFGTGLGQSGQLGIVAFF
jgi:hypothetical protein